MKKLLVAAFCVCLLAACGGGDNNAGSGGCGGNGSTCGSGCGGEEAPELKGLEGDERKAMEAALAFRDKMHDLKKRAEAASEDEKTALIEELDGMEGEFKKVDDMIEKLGEDGQKKFKAIKDEIFEIGESIEDALKPK